MSKVDDFNKLLNNANLVNEATKNLKLGSTYDNIEIEDSGTETSFVAESYPDDKAMVSFRGKDRIKLLNFFKSL